MKKILPLIIIGIFVFSTFGAVAINSDYKRIELELIDTINPIKERAFTHTVLGEFGTATWCGYCPYAHGALKQIYSEGYYPFYYVTMVGDKNKNQQELVMQLEGLRQEIAVLNQNKIELLQKIEEFKDVREKSEQIKKLKNNSDENNVI